MDIYHGTKRAGLTHRLSLLALICCHVGEHAPVFEIE